MKIIKKGKLFGIFNLLDIAIIVFVLAVMLPALHYYIKFNEKGIAEQKLLERFIKQEKRRVAGFLVGPQTGTLEARVSFKNLRKEDLAKIEVHDKEILPDGTILAEILWLGKPEPNYFIADLGQDTFLRTSPDGGLYSLPARVRLRGVITGGGTFKYKTKDVKQLFFFTFDAEDYEVDFAIEEASF